MKSVRATRRINEQAALGGLRKARRSAASSRTIRGHRAILHFLGETSFLLLGHIGFETAGELHERLKLPAFPFLCNKLAPKFTIQR
jgi:hypothetical protein